MNFLEKLTKFKLLRKILTITFMLLFGIVLVGSIIAGENADIISQQLGAQTYEKIDNSDPNQDTEYYKSDYTKVGDLIKAGKAKAEDVVAEGTVLLKNDNNALPLAKKSKVSLLGVTSYDPVYGGTGSGTINVASATTHVKSLEDAGLVLNPTLKEKYASSEWAQYKRKTQGSYGTTTFMINDAPWSVVDAAASTTFAEYGDAAIVFFGRIGGEGYDLINKGGDGIDNNDGLGKDYLGLTATELGLLEGLKAKKDAGTIKKIIVLINYSSMIEGDFIKDPKYGVDAAMWVGAVGIGGAAIGQLLTGDLTPSGRLPDTMWMDNAKNPVNANFGAFIYDNAAQFDVPDQLGTGMYPEATLSSYVVYQEGMYLGYRYTETRYEDVVLGTSKVGNYNYNDVVAYPFGYGLSYADFELSNVDIQKTGARAYEVSVKVTNKSTTYSGKCSVPVWVSKPYGKYAKDHKIQVPSVELVDFGKTGIIAPGKDETLKITVDEKFFSSYDADGAKGYVLMDGSYYVAVGGSAHEAVNNVLAAKKADGLSVDESKMVGGKGDANLVKKFNLGFDKDKYAFSDAVSSLDGKTNIRVTNLFDFADINRYSGRGDNHVDYYDRDNWDGTVSLDMANGHAVVKLTEQMAREIYAQVPEGSGKYNNAKPVPEKYKQPIAKDDGAYPTYDAKNGLNLIDLMYDSEGKPISFTAPIWDTFLDQLSWDETVKLVSSGFHLTEAVESVTKPATNDENGPNGFGGWAFFQGYYTKKTGLAYRNEVKAGHVDENGNLIRAQVDQDGYQRPTGFAANGVLAATFNKKLAEEVGNIIGEDGLWGGFSGLYGTGLNTHRSPYLGRTCEYYSECGTLAGLIAAAECKAIEAKGVHVYNKHCALNDQENCRHGICTWVPEQALREIYLRAFELPITMGNAFNTMASFSRFGTFSAAACRELGTDFLRGECGMKGIIVTDAYGDMNGNQNCDPYYEHVYGVLVGGCDIPDGAQPKNENHFDKFKTGYSQVAWAMRLSAKRLCYQTLWSNAMNGYSSGTRIVMIMPWWQALLLTFEIIFGVLFGLCALWTVLANAPELLKK